MLRDASRRRDAARRATLDELSNGLETLYRTMMMFEIVVLSYDLTTTITTVLLSDRCATRCVTATRRVAHIYVMTYTLSGVSLRCAEERRAPRVGQEQAWRGPGVGQAEAEAVCEAEEIYPDVWAQLLFDGADVAAAPGDISG